MAKQIIALETQKFTSGDTLLRFAMWFPIALARQVPRPGAVSEWRDALAADNALLVSGAVLEETRTVVIPVGTGTPAVKGILIAMYNVRAAEIAALPNPNQFYGVFYDGTVWSA